DLWMVTWDATGVEEGNYLVHAIAIDESNQEDVLDYDCYDPATQNPEEVEAVNVDSQDPDANFTTITLPDGTVLDVSNPAVQPYIAGSNKWLEICADGSSDIARMLFEYSLDGGVNWTTLDVNDDNDFYADIDDTLGFQALGEDEIFNDLNGNFMYDGPEVDFVRYAGLNGVVDTPIGFALIPLTGEDEAGDSNGDLDDDDDGDGLVDEDQTSGDESPQDYTSPFCVYLNIQDLMLWADVNVLFRATASDQICDNFREDPTPAVLSVIIGENMPPEADVIRAEDQDGNEMDVWPPIMDDSGVVTIGADTDTMRVFVTAEDITAIMEVDLYYRLDPSCYPDLPYEDNLWRSMSDEGWTQVDNLYPYDFNVATDLIPDGSYQFFPRAVDEGGNATLPPRNPWEFKKFADASTDFAMVTLPQNPDSAAVGDEYTIAADLIDPSQEEAVSVSFYFAPRRMGESIDPTLVQPLAPYTSPELDETVLSENGGCDGITLTINGEVGTCHESLAGVPAPTKLDFKYDAGNNAIVFGARPAGTDDILVSYDFGSWVQIAEGDEFAPYTVEWTAEEGGVPDPSDNGWDPEHTDAYDLIATAAFDINGDWLFDEECDYFESPASEGNYLILKDTERPLVQIYGLNFSEEYRDDQGLYPDWNLPGNPLFTCGDDVNDGNDWDMAAVLSGKETDVFVVAEDQGGGSITSVNLAITAEDPETGDEDEVAYDMTLYSSASTIDIPVTFYPEDYPQWDPADIENVILYVSADDGDTFPYKYRMTAMPEGCYQATGRFFVGTSHQYEFEVDLV
ncbi:MAG: hypothetical protein KDB69_07470, partial [Acidimicrobiia bacterium]|nr:hypothetical protein [Acidimicrobiia bacterium]